MAAPLFMGYSAEAIVWPPYETGAFIAVAPNPIGLGQQVIINAWIDPLPQMPFGDLGGIVNSNVGFTNVTVTFTRPDGTKDTFKPQDPSLAAIGIGPGYTESVGALYFYYQPNMVGNWSVIYNFPGQTFVQYNSPNDTRYYQPCTSKPFYFTVQKDPVKAGILDGSPYAPLPTNYWKAPVNINNREWSTISGDWLISGFDNSGTKYNPYSTGPTTAHVVWKQQQVVGGLIGGDWGSMAYYGGQTCIVMNGKVFYNSPYGGTFNCLDLTTGKLLYTANGTISRGLKLLPAYQVAAQQNEGIPVPYLINTGTYQFYDPMTGAQIMQLTNVPSGLGTPFMQDGNPMVYYMSRNNIIAWNFSKLTGNNWQTGLVYNVSMAQPGAFLQYNRNYVLNVYTEAGVILAYPGNNGATFSGYDLNTGKWLWTTNTTYQNVQQMPSFGFGGPSGPYIQFDAATSSFVGYDVKTGVQIWKTPVGEYPWGDIPAYYAISMNGVRYSPRYDGHIYAVDEATGKIIWTSPSVGETGETVESTWIFGGSAYAGNGAPGVGADGKLYVSTQTNYRGQPMTRFNRLFCINATTGEFIWNVTGAIATTAVANGYLLGNNGDDGTLYCFGKGQTATSVQAPMTELQKGQNALITGSVLDLSPAQPNTPAISDADMTTMMNYYMQNDATSVNNPPTPTGVPVTLSVFDPNGNTYKIGQATTDANGNFGFVFTPPVPGLYRVIATFSGTNSYFPSSATTYLVVTTSTAASPTATPIPSSGPTATTNPTQAPTASPSPSAVIVPPASGVPTSTYVAIGAAIIIAVAIATALILRRRK